MFFISHNCSELHRSCTQMCMVSPGLRSHSTPYLQRVLEWSAWASPTSAVNWNCRHGIYKHWTPCSYLLPNLKRPLKLAFQQCSSLLVLQNATHCCAPPETESHDGCTTSCLMLELVSSSIQAADSLLCSLQQPIKTKLIATCQMLIAICLKKHIALVSFRVLVWEDCFYSVSCFQKLLLCHIYICFHLIYCICL